MGSPRESEVSLAVAAGAETPVVVQDAKVLPVGHKGRESPLFDGDGGERKSPRAAQAANRATSVVALSRQGLDARSADPTP
jgi:hypothetical protein